jgi:hypothetical protein
MLIAAHSVCSAEEVAEETQNQTECVAYHLIYINYIKRKKKREYS